MVIIKIMIFTFYKSKSLFTVLNPGLKGMSNQMESLYVAAFGKNKISIYLQAYLPVINAALEGLHLVWTYDCSSLIP